MTRRRLVAALALSLTLAAASSTPAQEKYPSRPVALIVPFNAGGGTDLVARAFAEALKKELGQPALARIRRRPA